MPAARRSYLYHPHPSQRDINSILPSSKAILQQTRNSNNDNRVNIFTILENDHLYNTKYEPKIE
jgi:hypothetical protein